MNPLNPVLFVFVFLARVRDGNFSIEKGFHGRRRSGPKAEGLNTQSYCTCHFSMILLHGGVEQLFVLFFFFLSITWLFIV